MQAARTSPRINISICSRVYNIAKHIMIVTAQARLSTGLLIPCTIFSLETYTIISVSTLYKNLIITGSIINHIYVSLGDKTVSVA